MRPISRRDFVKGGAGALAVASSFGVLYALREGESSKKYLKEILHEVNMEQYAGIASYTDKVRTTCGGNCTQACGLNVYLKGNLISRIQQAADYHTLDPVAGDAYNPRGCMRGA